MSKQQKIIFTAGIDSDTSSELLPSNKSRYRLNVRVLSSDNDTEGAIETVSGNQSVSYALPAGVNKAIGSCEDLIGKKIYYFVYNTLGNHSILEFNESALSITKVFQSSILNFDPDHLITGINVVYLTQDTPLLYWTDNYNEPRKLNITKAKYFSAGNFVLGYKSPFDPEILYRIKQPPLVQPFGEYGDDPLQPINYLEQKLFQFKAAYFYDDKEETATSPISKTIYPKCNCGLTEDSVLNNFIAVTIDTGIDIVTRIKIFAKEVNSSDFVEIVDLNKAELQIASNSNYTYNFYNNGNYLPLEVNKSIKLYDRVPKKSQAQEIIKGEKIVDGNITEEFDPVDIDMKLNLSLADDIAAPTFNIQGYLQIINFCRSVFNTDYNKQQPIYIDSSSQGHNNIAFGGIHAQQPCEGHTQNADDPSGYNQLIPLGGFTVYLAGTNHYGVSVQHTSSHGTQVGGVYQVGGISDRNDMRDAITAGDVYSTWTIPGVPAGTYIMRVASHLTTQGALDDGAYQQTSTYTVGVCGYAMNECVLTVSTIGDVTIASDTYFYDSSTLKTVISQDRSIYIADTTSGNGNLWNAGLCPSPGLSPSYCAAAGYLKDDEGHSIELAQLEIQSDSTVPPNMFLYTASLPHNSFIESKKDNLNDEICSTDHNGFYWSMTSVPIKQCVNNDNFELGDVFLGVTSVFSDIAKSGTDHICYRLNQWTTTYSPVNNNLRTRLTGTINYQGNPIAGAVAITTDGHYSRTDSDGNFSITIYQDSGSSARSGTLYYYLEGNCIAFFGDENFDNYTFNIASGGGTNYNYTHTPPLYSVNIVNILGDQPINSLKRGGVYPYGIVYYDHANRSGLTNVNDWRYDEIPPAQNKYGTNLFIPFYTETTEVGSADLSYTMIVDGANILYAGQDYTAPTIAFSGGGATTDATATLSLGAGLILSFSAVVNDTGLVDGVYLNEPLTGGTGTGGTADITIVAGTIESIIVNAPGTGYITGDVLASAVTGSAAFTINSDAGTITGIIITLPGSGYTSIPTLTITDATGADAIISPTFAVEDPLIIVTGGFGYSVIPGISFFGGSPSTVATAIATIVNGVVVSTELTDPGAGYETFPTLIITGKVWGGSYPIVGWEIYNEPPQFATHYQIIRGKDSSTNYYIDFVVDEITYDVPNSQMHITVKNIYTTFKTLFPDSILTYDFVTSQRIRFIKDAAGDFYQNYFDFKIKSFDIATGVITTEIDNLMPTIAIGALFEIYFPKLTVPVNQEIVFEIGETHSVSTLANGYRIHGGGDQSQIISDWSSSSNSGGFLRLVFASATFSDSDIGRKIKLNSTSYDSYGIISSVTSSTIIVTDIVFTIADATGTIYVAATGEFNSGDTFYRFRTMPYDSGTALTKLRFIQDNNFSDFYHSEGYDLGRPNEIDPEITEVTRPSTIYWSENLIPETDINGLSSVFDSNFESYNDSYGGIYKLRYRDQMLRVFRELKVGKIPVNMIVYNSASIDPATTVGASNELLGTEMQYYDGEFGIGRNPESYSEYGHVAYFYDLRRGTPVRLSTDGMTPIGDTAFMHTYFNDKSQALLATGINPKIYGVYDIKFKEYIVAFALTGGEPAETLAFNERANEWSTFYSYHPEGMCTNGTGIITFNQGTLYRHNINPNTAGTFYGVNTPAEIWAVLNIDPSKEKVFQAVSVENIKGSFGDEIWKIPSITSPNGQSTRMIQDANWVNREDSWYAYVKRDLNTVNVINPIINGNPMRDRTFLVKFKYSSLFYNKLFAANFYVIGSERSNK